ncbi:MAG: pseudaminic acid synthase [Defluviitaleaceae bacterium]|nr:pseudaminic acid synthase [Defluviitaleaceae bacterium]
MGTFIIAELSANHNQDLELAKKTILAAKESGADGVKLQTYTPDTITIDCDKSYFQINYGSLWDGTTLYKLYQKAYTPWEWHEELFSYGRSLGLVMFSTPFDYSAVDFLEGLGNPIYKIASFEAMDYPLIKYAAAKGKPMVISLGLLSLEEIGEMVEACREVGNEDITLLVCTSQYPAKPEDAQLLKISDIAARFGVKVGLSDHTMGSAVASAAVALGACVIEKHFVLDRELGGVDSAFSMTPDEFRQMVDAIRVIEKAVSAPDYTKISSGRVHARSLFVVADIKKGEKFTAENVRSIRPSHGLHPKYYPQILGSTATCDIERGTPLAWDMTDCRAVFGDVI